MAQLKNLDQGTAEGREFVKGNEEVVMIKMKLALGLIDKLDAILSFHELKWTITETRRAATEKDEIEIDRFIAILIRQRQLI